MEKAGQRLLAAERRKEGVWREVFKSNFKCYGFSGHVIILDGVSFAFELNLLDSKMTVSSFYSSNNET